MGFLAQQIQAMKLNVECTTVRIISAEDGETTSINLIDPMYSLNGSVIKEHVLPSFSNENAEVYTKLFNFYFMLAMELNEQLRSGTLFTNN